MLDPIRDDDDEAAMSPGRRTVVVVEDDADQRTLIVAALARSPHYHIAGHAERARDAVARVQADQPDIVLLDLRLRESTGQESIPDLLVVAPQAMIVAISGYDDPDAREQALSTGAFAFVAKGPWLYLDDNLVGLLDTLCHRFALMLQGEEMIAPIVIDADADSVHITTKPFPLGNGPASS